MSAKTTLNKVKAILGLQVALEQMKLDNGTIVEAEVFEANNEIFIVNGEEKIPLPIGEYVLENGMIVVISEEGVIAEIKEKQEEAPIEEEVVEEQEMEAEPTGPKKVIESVSKEMFFAEIEKLRNEFLTKLSEQKPVEVELEKVEPIKHSPESIVEKKVVAFAKNRPMTTQDRVFNKLFNK